MRVVVFPEHIRSDDDEAGGNAIPIGCGNAAVLGGLRFQIRYDRLTPLGISQYAVADRHLRRALVPDAIQIAGAEIEAFSHGHAVLRERDHVVDILQLFAEGEDGKRVRIQGDDTIADRLPIRLCPGIEAVKLLVIHGEDEFPSVIGCGAIYLGPHRGVLRHSLRKNGKCAEQADVVLRGFIADLDLRVIPALVASGEPAALGLQREDEVRSACRRLEVLRPLLIGCVLRSRAQRQNRPGHIPRRGRYGVGILLPAPILPEARQSHRHPSRCDRVSGIAFGIAADIGVAKPSVLKGPIVRLGKYDGIRDLLHVPLRARMR